MPTIGICDGCSEYDNKIAESVVDPPFIGGGGVPVMFLPLSLDVESAVHPVK